MNKLRILLTGAGAPGAGSIIECLKLNGECEVDIIGADRNDSVNTVSLFEMVYKVPEAEDDSFIQAIKEICKKERIDVIVPLVTRELVKFAKHKREFEEIGTKVNVIDYESMIISNDKGNLLTFLKDNDMDVPKFYIAKSVSEIEKYAILLGYPKKDVCIKRTIGNGSRAIRILSEKTSRYEKFFNEKPNSMITTLEDIKKILSERDEIPTMMVMESIPGVEWGVDLLAKNGEVSNILCRKTTIVQHSIPLECITRKNAYIENYCKKVAKLLNITGNIGFDFKEDEEGIPKLLEINPRLAATVAINNAAGINFPWLGVKQCLGKEIITVEKISDVKMTRRYREEFSFIEGE